MPRSRLSVEVRVFSVEFDFFGLLLLCLLGNVVRVWMRVIGGKCCSCCKSADSEALPSTVIMAHNDSDSERHNQDSKPPVCVASAISSVFASMCLSCYNCCRCTVGLVIFSSLAINQIPSQVCLLLPVYFDSRITTNIICRSCDVCQSLLRLQQK